MLPGVQAVAAVSALPYGRHARFSEFGLLGANSQPGRPPVAQIQAVSPDYFRALHIPLRAGRLLGDRDRLSAVLSEEAARGWWPSGPIGQQIRLGARWLTIVGVVGGVKASVMDRAPRPTVYVPYAEFPEPGMDIAIRCAGDPLALAAPVRSAVKAVDPEQPVADLMTLERMRRNEAIGLTYAAALMSVFGFIALALSCIGVYGMTAYLVSERTHEIGVRMALGAAGPSVLGMIFRQGARAVLAGIALGLLLALALARVLAAIIWGVRATDPGAFTAIPLLLISAAALAIYLPARRAVRIDPLTALRHE
ncbi:MAG: ABC transporter permease [Acidobacteriia bacterium]|nr:ABC transporter permease [Terriglobia bacterium]